MELINHTAYPAIMFRSGLNDFKYAMSVAVRVTYDIENGNAIVSENQEWKLERQQWQSEYGLVESDDVFKRGGVDILLFGSAKAPKGIPVKSMNVEVKFNNKTINKIAVLGDRVWEKSILGMDISTPKPFTEMPLTLENTYGGQAEWDGLKIPHHNNPYGKGFNYAKEDYVGKPLPNIENPDKLIRKWTDQPDPVGVACLPQLCELHMRNNIAFDKDGKMTKFEARFYNTAFPAMIVDKIKENDVIEITGMSDTPFQFKVPAQTITMKVSMNERSKEWQMYIEQIGLVIAKQKAFITYRYPINYTITPLETRKCEIFKS
jgi:hypothetical protein